MVCLSAARFRRSSRGFGWNFKNSGFALRQFKIPGAKAPVRSYAETAPMQPDKPTLPPHMASALEICGNNCFLRTVPLLSGSTPGLIIPNGYLQCIFSRRIDYAMGAKEGRRVVGRVFEATLRIFPQKGSGAKKSAPRPSGFLPANRQNFAVAASKMAVFLWPAGSELVKGDHFGFHAVAVQGRQAGP